MIGRAPLVSAFVTRRAETTKWKGRLSLSPAEAANSGDLKRARRVVGISPLLCVNAEAVVVTAEAGGTSEMKRRQSFVAMKVAVAGWEVTISSTRSRSRMPRPAGI